MKNYVASFQLRTLDAFLFGCPVPKPLGPVASSSGPPMASNIIEHHAVVSRGVTLTVAERAPAPIIGLTYGLPLYFAR